VVERRRSSTKQPRARLPGSARPPGRSWPAAGSTRSPARRLG